MPISDTHNKTDIVANINVITLTNNKKIKNEKIIIYLNGTKTETKHE